MEAKAKKDKKTSIMHLSLNKEVYSRLMRDSEQKGITVNGLVRMIINTHFDRQERS